MVFRLDNVGKEFGGTWIFRGISAQCNPSERIGLIGRNGCGKSTLTALILGSLEPDEGRVQRARPLQISSVEQSAKLDPDLSILDEVLKVFAPLSRIQEELHQLEAEMSEVGGKAFDKAAEAYEGLQLRFQLQGGYDFKARAQSMLLGLSFSAAEFEMPCRNLSGGQQTRILLGKALASPGQMMLLDEPTNHLDLSAILWLTRFLQTLKTSFVLVSHDRHLLDQVTTRTWELEGGFLHDYPASFSRSRELRRQRRTLKEQEYLRQQELRLRTEDFIRRNIMGQKTKQAQSRRKMLEKLKPLEKPLEDTRSLKIQLRESARGGALSLSVEEGEVGYPEKPLLTNLSLRIARGDRVGILGGNGSGKSTLLKVLVGELSLLAGRLDAGLNNSFMYYSQNSSIGDGERTVYDFLRELDTYCTDEDIRSLAARRTVALSEQPGLSEDLVLVVDVGTNAEILLGDRDRVLACSSPTGPAFEGAQISSGQRAAPGAIEAVRIDPATKEPRLRVIGCPLWSDEPGFAEATAASGITGICGSGIIEAVAEMRIAGLLDAGGLIGSAEQTGSARCIPEGRTHAYVLHDGRAEGGPLVTVTQGDIRAIQLAKSALYAGARLLMDTRGVDRVDRVVLAGAFGAHISPLHAMVLGMIPDVPLDKVSSAGNAAGTGARIALCSLAARRQIERDVHAITKVETAIEPRFQEHFVAANAIPHASAPFPELARHVTLPDVRFNAHAEGGGRRRRRRG